MTANQGPEPDWNREIDRLMEPVVYTKDILETRNYAIEQLENYKQAIKGDPSTHKLFGKTCEEWQHVLIRATMGDVDTDYTVTGEKA